MSNIGQDIFSHINFNDLKQVLQDQTSIRGDPRRCMQIDRERTQNNGRRTGATEDKDLHAMLLHGAASEAEANVDDDGWSGYFC